jgi:hypothetical protein
MSIWVGFESLFVVVVVVGEEGLEIWTTIVASYLIG